MKHTQTHPEIPIVFEDPYLLVINKPANLLSQQDHTGDSDVVGLCKKYLTGDHNSNPYVGLVHRLDRPVSGLMLLAKTPQAAKNLAQQLRDRTMQKTYRAVVEGEPPPNGVFTHHLLKNRPRNIVRVVSPGQRNAKKAILSFVTLTRRGGLNLLSVHLQTGRPHQIRVQLAHEGFPIWGDYKYGPDQPDGRPMALRAAELAFTHPADNKEIRLELQAPPDEPWVKFISFNT